MRKRVLCTSIALTIVLVLVAGCGPTQPASPTSQAALEGKLIIFNAGSLTVPLDELTKAFQAKHPGVTFESEASGSNDAARKISELSREADLMMSADYTVIDKLLIPDFADWNVRFARNTMVIAYTPQSAYTDEITADNWYEIVSRPDVLLGLSDPRFDACGYRALMAARLAENYYSDDNIFRDMFGSRLTPVVQVETRDEADVIQVPETLQPKENSGLVVRGSSVRLLGLLESGDLDYAFEYKSVSRQHALEFLALPPEIDLGDEAHAADYKRVRVRLDFQRFASVKPEFVGRPIAYGITIPANAPHPDLAVSFIQFLVGPEGQVIMARNHQPMIVPPVTDNTEALPVSLEESVAR